MGQGNRYKWNEVKNDIEVTAVELDEECARLYQERFPHDKVIVNGTVGKLKGDLKHYVFDNLRHNVDTNNSYSSIMAEDLNKNNKKFSFLKLIFKPLGKFLETYIYKRGFLDGMPGFIIAIGAAYSMFLKFAKLWEAQNAKKHD